MQSENLLIINLAHVDEATKRLDFALTNDFFADLEQEEIIGGDLHANICIKAITDNIFNITINVKGIAVVACDRCLDSLEIPVDVEDTIKIKDGNFDEGDDIELKYTQGKSSTYDLSWDIYEIIETSLPLQRVHEEGKCNTSMVSYIISDNEEL